MILNPYFGLLIENKLNYLFKLNLILDGVVLLE
jgi:hypothetical protein